MRITSNRLLPACAALVFASGMVMPSAYAACGLPMKLAKPAAWHSQTNAAHVLEVSEDDHERKAGAPIVGMWHVVFTADTSNGGAIPNTIVDNSLAVWHSDQTEIMNSLRPPQDGDFCLGVWEQTGRNTYFLNHFPWFANAYPNDTNNGIGDPTGPTRITETITLAPDCNHFSGTFTLDAYDLTGKIVVQSFTGSLAGTRVNPHTVIGDLL